MKQRDNPMTIAEAVIITIKKHPKKQATLDEIYNSVRTLMDRDIPKDTIRGNINRATVAARKSGRYKLKYRPKFIQVGPSTYALAEETDS